MTTQDFKVEKKQIVNVPVEYQEEEGCVAFQLVDITINFFGSKRVSTHDTKILKDGRQVIIDGNGWVKSGFEIN